MSKSNKSGRSKSTGKPAVKSTSPHFPHALYQRMSDDLHLNGKAERTRKGYLRAITQLANYCKQSPDKISEDQLRRYFLHIKNNLKYAYGTLRVALSGVQFFYRITCKRDWDIFSMLKLQNINALPEVITIAQVHQIIDAATTLRMKTYFWTVYSLGLRLNEALHLEVGDIDAARGLGHVHRGKGAKDRYIPLPTSTLNLLRQYWLTHRHPRLLFPADGRDHTLRNGAPSQATGPMSETAVQYAIVLITEKLNFGKKVSTHTLRHSYATHLLEARVSLRAIQKYMGHSSLQTTLVYLHLTQTAEEDARSTIENLFQRKPEKIEPSTAPVTQTKSKPSQPAKPTPASKLPPAKPPVRK